MDRVERLLRVGYFPAQLPPCFITNDLAANYVAFLAAWDALVPVRDGKKGILKSPDTKAEIFSVARVGHQRRTTSIPNPIAQTYLSRRIIQHWKEITSVYRKSKISASRPRFLPKGGRATSITSMQLLYDRKITNSAGYRFMLKTDLSRFFPTIYTHSVPWAVHTKSKAKRNRSQTSKWYGNLLDLDLRQCQDGQTIGIPIGPDTSHIIAEAVASAVDIEFNKHFKRWPAGFRYVDDYFLFFETAKEAEQALAALIRALREFELQINFEKTKTCPVIEITDDFWTHRLSAFDITSKGVRHASDVNHFFELAKNLARANSDESVMLYALKRISATIVRKDCWDAFEAHLCHVAMAYPNTLQMTSRILSSYSRVGYPLNKNRLSRMINSIIEDHALVGHHSEVSWCLWIAKELELNISEMNVDFVSEMNSSVCALLLMDMSASGMLAKTPPNTFWRKYQTTDALWGELWLLSYEAGVRGWGGFNSNHVIASPHFSILMNAGVRFYDDSVTLPPLFQVKPAALKAKNLENENDFFDLDFDDDLEDLILHDSAEGAYEHGLPFSEIEEEDEDLF
ncbi:MAG: RNA-directed DNA polymerase [Limnobacter sp.]|uniref:RNA-directed DNA polymerase n=1 Tax=Limnobacter sp. TaxID=2003368 RepID=UPI0022CCD49F|nr:RNA-directed DNA polymerase [Limnobacter sp.]MCZ8015158.1 RNA-directed DNA polymerase [Limnobacter sp.]